LNFLRKNSVVQAINSKFLNDVQGFVTGFVTEVTTGYEYLDCLTSASGFIAGAVDYAVDNDLKGNKIKW